jgi:4-nitrophenyl phosphatase
MLDDFQNFIIDMDGVLWHGDRPMRGLQAFFERLRARGARFVLATNNASRTAADYQQKLAGMGVTVSEDEILTSPQATAGYLAAHAPQARVYVIGERGLRDDLAARGLTVLAEDTPSGATHVVVGIDRQLTYAKLMEACLLIRAGATYIGTNPDLTFPGERGVVPGNGSILAALTAATGVQPLIIGKPEPEMMLQALTRMNARPVDTLVIGDRLDTDILGGLNAGLQTLLVLSGISSRAENEAGPIRADFVADGIWAL